MNLVTIAGILLMVVAVVLLLLGRPALPVFAAGAATVAGSYLIVAIFKDIALDSLTSWMTVGVLVAVVVVLARSSGTGRRILAWVGGALALVVAVYLAPTFFKHEPEPTSAAPYQDDLATCPAVVFIGARGSGEERSDAPLGGTATPGSGYGGVVGPIRDRVRSELAERGVAMGDYPVDYPALPVYSPDSWSLVDDLVAGKGEYIRGADQGAVAVAEALATIVATCGDSSRVIVVGYSQGALAVHAGVNGAGDAAGVVASVQFISDPARLATDPEPTGLTMPGDGVAVELGVISMAPVAGALSWCALGDPVCGYSDVENPDYGAHFPPYADAAFTERVVGAILADLDAG